MKRSTKNGLFGAFTLIILGIVLICVALGKGGWDLSALNTRKTVTAVHEIDKDFQDISIHSETEDIEILPSEDGKCKVVFVEPENTVCSAAVQNGTLQIETTDASHWYDHISLFSWGSSSITVYLPEAEYGSLQIHENTGDITLAKGLTFESMDLSLSTGDIDCWASARGRIRVDGSTSDIHMSGISAGAVDITVSTGRIEGREVTCEEDIKINVSTGKTVLNDVSCRDLTTSGSTGDVDLNHVIAAGSISIERSTGDVEMEKCDAAELTIETDTGDVEGSLLSEKVFIVKSDTGRIDVPETITGGKCKITTDTGDIRITTP